MSTTLQDQFRAYLANKSESLSSAEELGTEGRVTINKDAELCIRDVAPQKHKEMQRTLAQILLRFKLDWKMLKATMLTTGAVILGSVALVVLQGGEFVPQDLDIYVTSESMAMVLVFLQEQGYAVQIPAPVARKNSYPKTSVKLTFQNDTGEKIDLVATTEQHVVHTITRFHSTCVMNYIAYYGIVCLYPDWTMRKTAFVKADVRDEQNIHKYRGRGFTMIYAASDMPEYEPAHKCGRHACCPKARRELHDHVTLCISLEDEDSGLTIKIEEDKRVQWVLEKDYICNV